MKFLYAISNKAKPALLLMAVVLIILGSSFLEKQLMKDLNTSVSSIYKDRLIPAAELFRINDLMYNRRLILEKFLMQPTAEHRKAAQAQLAAHTGQIDSTIQKLENTYLVAEESRCLRDFKVKMSQYNTLEEALIATSASRPKPRAVEKQMAQTFKEIHRELVLLSDIQIKVGEELLLSSEITKENARILSNLQIALVIIITLVVQQALLLDSHPLIPKNLKNFRLN